DTGRDWRPSLITIDSEKPTNDHGGLRFMGWLCEKYGFGTYIYRIDGMLDEESYASAREVQERLVEIVQTRYGGLYTETMISPSWKSALAQGLQLPGVSGLDNNSVLFSCPARTAPGCYEDALEGALFASATRKNLLILRYTDPSFGTRAQIHIWLTWHDRDNVNLMLLLAYILLGHDDWRRAELRVFAAFPEEHVAQAELEFAESLRQGRLPISESNIEFLSINDGHAFRALVADRSAKADLVLIGATVERLRSKGRDLLEKHPRLENVLIVAAAEEIRID
ncbi:MAG: hypothetical protein AAGC55_26055, partial [Myxococcota bacterium]